MNTGAFCRTKGKHWYFVPFGVSWDKERPPKPVSSSDIKWFDTRYEAEKYAEQYYRGEV
jgi:hypothetical protein